MTEIARLLAEARALHLQKKHHAGKVGKDGSITSSPNYPAAEQCIFDALTLRLQAQEADPAQADPAWADDLIANRGVTSPALCQWFVDYLTVDPISPLAHAFKADHAMRENAPENAIPHTRDTSVSLKDG